MLIGMMMTLGIICLLIIGPTFENTWVAIAVYGGLIVGAILAFYYSDRLSGGIANTIMGGSGGKTKQAYSLAERYVTERKYAEAIEEYLKAIAKEKKNPVPRLRLADIYYKLRDYDNCIKYLSEAVQLPKGLDEHERCNRINRLADLYIEQKRDRAAAVRALKLILNEFPKSKSALYARERIVEIKKGA
jgi:tetratricopeptide (TPR) repeat protein